MAEDDLGGCLSVLGGHFGNLGGLLVVAGLSKGFVSIMQR